VKAGGPQTNTSRSDRSGKSPRRCSDDKQVGVALLAVVAGDHMHLGCEAFELIEEDRLVLGDDAVHDNRVAGQLLEQRADRGDADPAGDQERLRPPGSGGGERGERAFGDQPGPGLDVADGRGEVAQLLHGDPHGAVGGRCRERERVRLRPPTRGEEASEKELAGAGPNALQIPSGDLERDDAGALRAHACDAKPVPESRGERREDAVPDEHCEGREIERLPVVGGGLVQDELVAGL
jgi:hypothetical protein